LETLVKHVLEQYLAKDDILRKNDDWEECPFHPELLNYAAWDVHASWVIY
jgi:hypothetical protein